MVNFNKFFKMKIVIINGPNLNLLGTREPGIYGDKTFDAYYVDLKISFPDVEFDYFQSNIEGVLIDTIQKEGFSCDGILLNAAAYTHTSVGIRDAIKAIDTPVVEIHFQYLLEGRFQAQVLSILCGKRNYRRFWIGQLSPRSRVSFKN